MDMWGSYFFFVDGFLFVNKVEFCLLVDSSMYWLGL